MSRERSLLRRVQVCLCLDKYRYVFARNSEGIFSRKGKCKSLQGRVAVDHCLEEYRHVFAWKSRGVSVVSLL